MAGTAARAIESRPQPSDALRNVRYRLTLDELSDAVGERGLFGGVQSRIKSSSSGRAWPRSWILCSLTGEADCNQTECERGCSPPFHDRLLFVRLDEAVRAITLPR